jgi:DNA segregation ATPase FtsK/SpoIIIE-like protein
MNVGDVWTVVSLIGGASSLAWLGTRIAQSVYDGIYARYRQVRWDTLSYLGQKQQLELESIRVLQPDDHGRSGIAFDGKVYRDLDSRAVFTQELNKFFDPLMERLNQQHKMLVALSGMKPASGVAKALDAGDLGAASIVWPDVVRMAEVMSNRRASINDLVIGAYPTDSGLQVVSLSLHDLMHTLTVGAAGWGKSSWLRWLLWQIAQSVEPVEVVAVDVSGSEFNVMRDWGKLRYPVARTTEDAIATLAAVSDEIAHRRQLYEDNAPVASKLTEYNQATKADLPPWLLAVDEGTHLLNQAGLGEPLRVAVQTARQYGVYVLLAGQSAKHSVIDTQVRDNFSSRLCFRTSPASSRVVLDASVANELHTRGRFFAQLVGQELQELQAPFVTREEFQRTLTNGGPRNPTPVVDQEVLDNAEAAGQSGLTVEQIERARDLWGEGKTFTEIAQEIYGYKNDRVVKRIQGVIEAEDW